MDHASCSVGDRERRVFSRALDALESVPISSRAIRSSRLFRRTDSRSAIWRLRSPGGGRHSTACSVRPSRCKWVGFAASHGKPTAASLPQRTAEICYASTKAARPRPSPRRIQPAAKWACSWPCLTPTRGKILVTVVTNAPSDPYSIASLDVSAGTRTTLLRGTYPQLVKTGHLLFANDGAIWAVRFDAQRAQVVGSPVRVLESVATTLRRGGDDGFR